MVYFYNMKINLIQNNQFPIHKHIKEFKEKAILEAEIY